MLPVVGRSRRPDGARPADRHGDHARAARRRGHRPPRGAAAPALHARHGAARADPVGPRLRRRRAARRRRRPDGAVRGRGADGRGRRRRCGRAARVRCGRRRRAVRRAATSSPPGAGRCYWSTRCSTASRSRAGSPPRASRSPAAARCARPGSGSPSSCRRRRSSTATSRSAARSHRAR
ncbi:MAG: hypothetical protein E6J90_08570 [Deltaproteobacteria bacterium]|nr:MAG: hypothetical protein E6J90_08570 [Deltaproteobacteria bacterium]